MFDRIHICAEIGQNHNGSVELALEMIQAAKEAGADSVKFQMRTPSLCVPEGMKAEMKETPWGTMTYLRYREKLELSVSVYKVIADACKQMDIPWFASVWDVPSVERLMRFDTPYIKIPSACLTDSKLLEAVAGTGRPAILSTGMSTPEQVWHAVAVLRPGVICQCTSTYPCPVEELNLRCITAYQRDFPWATIGYSGHEVGLATTLAAATLGARYIERHFTLNRAMWGTDQAASVEPGGFKRLVKDIRNIEKALGDGVKRVYESEKLNMKRLRNTPGE